MNTALFHPCHRLEYEAVTEFFAADAQYELHRRKLRGRAEIRDVLNARPGPALTAHHVHTGGPPT